MKKKRRGEIMFGQTQCGNKSSVKLDSGDWFGKVFQIIFEQSRDNFWINVVQRNKFSLVISRLDVVENRNRSGNTKESFRLDGFEKKNV